MHNPDIVSGDDKPLADHSKNRNGVIFVVIRLFHQVPREDLITRTADNKELRIFTTTIPTEHRVPRLVYDPVHRLRFLTEVGMDEKSIGQGQDYVSGLTDIEGFLVWDVPPGRTRESAEMVWNTLSEEQKREVQAAAFDMWSAFLASAKDHVANAKIVHDRFHLSEYLGEAVDQARRTERKALQAEGDERLTGSRSLGLTHEENQSEKQAAPSKS